MRSHHDLAVHHAAGAALPGGDGAAVEFAVRPVSRRQDHLAPRAPGRALGHPRRRRRGERLGRPPAKARPIRERDGAKQRAAHGARVRDRIGRRSGARARAAGEGGRQVRRAVRPARRLHEHRRQRLDRHHLLHSQAGHQEKRDGGAGGLPAGGEEADRGGLHPVRLEHHASLHHGAGGARLHARSHDRRVSAVAPRHPDVAGGSLLQREREQLESLDAAGATRGRGVQERRGRGPAEKRALYRVSRGRLPSQSHLRRHLPLPGGDQLPPGQAPPAVRGGAARARGRAGGGTGDRRLPAHPRYRTAEPTSEDAARDREQGRRRVRRADSLGRGRRGSQVSDRKAVYGPDDWQVEPGRELGAPGAYPYTRGVHPTMYRGKLWTMRQYAGFGTAEETNARFRHLLAAGQTGLSVAFDLPTQMGYDSDHPMAEGEVGRAGVAIDTVDDLARLFDGIPLDRVSTSMTINATAPVLLAMYVVVGEEQGVPRGKLQGTVQNDILKEFIARGTYIYPIEPSLRLAIDVCRFVTIEGMSVNPISVSGYHMRGALAVGLDLNQFAPRLSFFFAAFTDLFEEVAKFRAARRLWARLMKEQFQANDAACRLRFHTQTGGSTLTAQQPENNVVRVAIQALAAVLVGTQSLHTNAYDEALALPTEQSATLALRRQQILAHETGIPETVDPAGGSWYVEALTDRVEREARGLLEGIERTGGAARAVERGQFQDAIARSAYEAQRAIESGESLVVGVNEYADEQDVPSVPAPEYSALARAQRRRVAEQRGTREAGRVQRTLEALQTAGRNPAAALMEPILDAVRARATVGEISDVLRGVWGVYRPA